MDNPDINRALTDFARDSGLPLHELESRIPRAINYIQNYSYAANDENTGPKAEEADHVLQLLEVVGLESFPDDPYTIADLCARFYTYDHPFDYPLVLINSMRSDRIRIGLPPLPEGDSCARYWD